MKPRLLETHGCQGIGHAGYVRAGWDVDAVDINDNHAKYHPAELIIGDAATYIREHGHRYHARHASPPCQWYTRGNIPGLVEQKIKVRQKFYAVRSPRPCDHSAHEWTAGAYGGARRDKYEARYIRHGGYVPPDKATVMALLGIAPADREGAKKTEPTWEGLFECLPPAYTEWVGTELLAHIEQEAAA